MIFIIFYLLLLAAIHAKLELMIEGQKSGWAINLPCWTYENKFIDWILGNKPITGYHFWLLIMFFVLFHSPYLFISFTIKKELFLLGLFCWYWIFEDWFWFLESKAFGLRNFRPGKIFWHKRWIWFLPYSYLFGMILGTTLLLLGGIK